MTKSCLHCKSHVYIDGVHWCHKASVGNGTIPKTTGPRQIPLIDGALAPEQCPYTMSDAWGSLLYNHPHPYGSACDGCQHRHTYNELHTRSCTCYNNIIHPTADSMRCPYREAKLSAPETIEWLISPIDLTR